jgi:hypothetical protein
MERSRATAGCQPVFRFRQLRQFTLHSLSDCLPRRMDGCHVVRNEYHGHFQTAAALFGTRERGLLHHFQFARCGLTTDQRSWLELRKLLRQVSPSKRPSSTKQRETWEEWCYRRAVRKTGRWQRFITGVLILHLLLLCLEWYPGYGPWEAARGKYLPLRIFRTLNMLQTTSSSFSLSSSLPT